MKQAALRSIIMIITAALSFQACIDKDSYNSEYYPNAIVTVMPNDDNTSVRLQLDDKTSLWPVNLKKSPFGAKEVRAYVNYRRPTAQELEKGGILADIQNVYVNWLDSIRTKDMAVDTGSKELNRKTYGNDPLEIVGSWETCVEDGYLTVRFRTYWGNSGKHTLNLVHEADDTDPYKITLFQDANGDEGRSVADATIAFRLDKLPSTGGEEVTLTLVWNSFIGEKTAKFKYISRN